MCTVLRMNRRFMEFMRKYHPDAANQRFKMTVISEDFSSDWSKQTTLLLLRVEFITNF